MALRLQRDAASPAQAKAALRRAALLPRFCRQAIIASVTEEASPEAEIDVARGRAHIGPCAPDEHLLFPCQRIDAAMDALMRIVSEAHPTAGNVSCRLVYDREPAAPALTRPGRAGGLGRAASAFRGAGGRFLSHAEVEALIQEEAERYAAGGRARARMARRAADGRFLPNAQGQGAPA